jgi:hypothetical protein
MKTWNTPEIRELNINATANGLWPTEYEFWPLVNDSQKATPPEDQPS